MPILYSCMSLMRAHKLLCTCHAYYVHNICTCRQWTFHVDHNLISTEFAVQVLKCMKIHVPTIIYVNAMYIFIQSAQLKHTFYTLLVKSLNRVYTCTYM